MRVDFIQLNAACPKDPDPLTDIDHMINRSSGYQALSFMVAYSRYNQIKMDPLDMLKMKFMSSQDNYYFNVMSFNLNNEGATCQRLMDVIFSQYIG